jgi:hypothetical protein
LIVSIGSIVYDYQFGAGPVAISPVFNVPRGVHHPPRILHFASAPGVFGRLEVWKPRRFVIREFVDAVARPVRSFRRSTGGEGHAGDRVSQCAKMTVLTEVT